MNIRPVGAELLHADGRTDMMKLIVDFRNFATALTNHVIYMYKNNITPFSSSSIYRTK